MELDPTEFAKAKLYLAYGRLMHEVQLFESNVKGLLLTRTAHELPNDASVEDGDALIEKYLRPGSLRRRADQLGIREDLAEEIDAAINTRNTLAHDYFPNTFVQVMAGDETLDGASETLVAATGKYIAVNAALDAILDEENAAAGITPADLEIPDDELRRMLRALREGQRQTGPLPDDLLESP